MTEQSGVHATALWGGLACGLGAGALWGMVFLAPELVPGFGPLPITIGRFFWYGLLSAVLIAPTWRRILPLLGRREWLALAGLGLLGNVVYFLLVVSAVQLGGAAMTSLIVGFVPVLVTIVGSLQRGAVPLRRLMPSLLLCGAGVACIAGQALFGPAATPPGRRLIGLLAATGALLSWTAYAVRNSHWLGRLDGITPHQWNLLTGLVTGLEATALIPLALMQGVGGHDAAAWGRLAAVTAALALLASVVANALWNKASRLLPLTLVGQMIVFETLFALFYAFLWERRGPSLAEGTAFLLVVASVLSCVAAHRRPRVRGT